MDADNIVGANNMLWLTDNLIWGWRLSLGLAAVPGTILLLGMYFLYSWHLSSQNLNIPLPQMQPDDFVFLCRKSCAYGIRRGLDDNQKGVSGLGLQAVANPVSALESASRAGKDEQAKQQASITSLILMTEDH